MTKLHFLATFSQLPCCNKQLGNFLLLCEVLNSCLMHPACSTDSSHSCSYDTTERTGNASNSDSFWTHIDAEECGTNRPFLFTVTSEGFLFFLIWSFRGFYMWQFHHLVIATHPDLFLSNTFRRTKRTPCNKRFPHRQDHYATG